MRNSSTYIGKVFTVFTFLFVVFLNHGCQVYEDNMFFTYIGTVSDESGNPVEDYEFGFTELKYNINYTTDENFLPQRGFLKLVYIVKTDINGEFKIVIPRKNQARFFFMTLGVSRFVFENHLGVVESEVRDIFETIVKSDQLVSDLGQIEIIFK